MVEKYVLILFCMISISVGMLLFTRRRRDRKISAKYLHKKIKDLTNLDHVLVLKKGGLKLYAQTFCSQELITELYSGLIDAISSVGELVGTGERLRRISYENYQVLICDGKHVMGCCVLRDVPTSNFLADALTVFVKKFEGRYAGTLIDWSGNLDVFHSAVELLDESFSTYLIYPISLMWDGNEESLSKLELNILKKAAELSKETSMFIIPRLVKEVQKKTRKSDLKLFNIINDLIDRGYFLPSTCI